MYLITDINKLKEHIYNTVLSSLESLTFVMLYKILNKQFKIERYAFKKAVDELVAAGDICYSYKHGCSFLENSLEKPVQISKRIFLVPHQLRYPKKADEIVIKMQSGISFGRGDHPTTRLALRGIEHAFELNSLIGNSNTNSNALDIGTGNGILAIACVLLGVRKALGIDIDKCAIIEAREHVIINGLVNKIKISDMPAEKITGHFSIITANLRYPTLKSLYPLIAKLTGTNSMLVFSGIKVSECDELSKIYTNNLFTYCWEDREKDWSAMVFKRF
ncbi:MAG: 50S ribosomal protein L11 methyltransferase [Pseudomonadota bacterium]